MPKGSGGGRPLGSQNIPLQQSGTSPYPLLTENSGSSVPEDKGAIFNTAVLLNTDFFDADLAPTNTPTTFRISFSCDAAGVLNVMRTAGGVTVTEHLNQNVALVADGLYEFNVTIITGQTINFQHSVGGTILSCIVVELYG